MLTLTAPEHTLNVLLTAFSFNSVIRPDTKQMSFYLFETLSLNYFTDHYLLFAKSNRSLYTKVHKMNISVQV